MSKFLKIKIKANKADTETIMKEEAAYAFQKLLPERIEIIGEIDGNLY